MKKILLAVIAFGIAMASSAQTDSTVKERADTIKIGGLIIIKKPAQDGKENKGIIVSNRKRRNTSNISTNWGILDIGFSNFDDKTDYSSAEAQAFAPGFNKDQLKLLNVKSR